MKTYPEIVLTEKHSSVMQSNQKFKQTHGVHEGNEVKTTNSGCANQYFNKGAASRKRRKVASEEVPLFSNNKVLWHPEA